MGRGNNISQEVDNSPLQFPRMPSLSSASDHHNNIHRRRWRHRPPIPTATPISFSALDIIRHVKHRPTSSNWPINSVELRQEENSYLFWLDATASPACPSLIMWELAQTTILLPALLFLCITKKQKNLVISYYQIHFSYQRQLFCSYKYFIYIYIYN
jgi:hypothetical protein